jgi:ribosomal-protein-alanine acetyltransferase
MTSDAVGIRIRRMNAADLERVMEIAASLRDAPKWHVSAYLAAIDVGNVPRRIGLVAAELPQANLGWRETGQEQTSGAKAHAHLAGPDAGTKVPAYHDQASRATIYSSKPEVDEVYSIASKEEEGGSGIVVGFAVASLVPPEAELETIAVAAEGQRHGVGGRLLGALVGELRAERVTELILEVRASNHAAMGFYRAQGFKETARRLRYYADPEEDAVSMRLSLA